MTSTSQSQHSWAGLGATGTQISFGLHFTEICGAKFKARKKNLRLVAAHSGSCRYWFVFVLEEYSRKKCIWEKMFYRCATLIAWHDIFSYRCVNMFCTIITAATVAKMWVCEFLNFWFVEKDLSTCNEEFEKVWLLCCVCGRESLQLLKHFSLWLQIYWYTWVIIFYNYKFHCHRGSAVLLQQYFHSSCLQSASTHARNRMLTAVDLTATGVIVNKHFLTQDLQTLNT